MASGAAPAPSAGRVDQYLLVKKIAMGGMAEIFLATDEKTGRTVALKKILPQISTDPDFLDRFFHEIRIQISLKHKNIVELLDCSPSPTQAYIVMEYVDGGSLQSLLEKAGRFPLELALFAVEESLRGLSAAHRKAIVHRDIKPQNIMWTQDGAVKIADFGISQAPNLTRLTLTGTVVGTPSHMSPEQARGELLDQRSDLFSIGTVLYELLTGTNPFTAPEITATLRRVVDHDPEPPSILDPTLPPSVDAVVRKLHAKEREQRYQTADEALEAVRAVLTSEGFLSLQPLFRVFAADPRSFMAQRKAQKAAEMRSETKKLLADQNAPPEQALWSAYQTLTVVPEDAAAQELFKIASERAGQRDRPVDNVRIRELEEKLRKDPDNLSYLLQLAKLYRLEKDFVNLMRFFRKLQVIAPPDAYTQGQISALVSQGGATSARTAPAVGPTVSMRRAPQPVVPEPDPENPAWHKFALGGGFAALLIFGIWWARRPGLDISQATPEQLQQAEAAAERYRQGSAAQRAPVERRPVLADSDEDLLQKALTRADRLEREGSPSAAIAYLRDMVNQSRSVDLRASLLFAMAEVSGRVGNRSDATSALDEAAALGGEHRTRAAFLKADLLESAQDPDGANRIFEELLLHGSASVQTKARLRLAMSAERAANHVRALSLYEEIIARASDAPEANPARLGAAALYRQSGRADEARRLYEDVKRLSPAGSDYASSAEKGLLTLQ